MATIRSSELFKISDDKRIDAATLLADAAYHSLLAGGIDMTERQCLELADMFRRIANHLEIASITRAKDTST